MTDFLVQYCTHILNTVGYPGLTFLMALESMVFPLPSEAIMPFAGFLWYSGEMNIYSIILASTIGSLIGSILSYFMGYWGGKKFFKKYGKYFFLNEEHLFQTEHFFKKHGGKSIFICRFIPIVRHFISIPAGLGKMNILKFLIYTTLGAALWNGFLAYLGYILGSHYEKIKEWGSGIDKIFIGIIILAIAAWIINKRKSKKN